MELILLKSCACLLAFLLFYKIALQPLSIHKIKRVYLLLVILVSALIPFITFIKYVDPTFNVNYLNTFHSDPIYTPIQEVVLNKPISYLSIILWSIYSLGVVLFLVRFCINLFGIISKIKKHKKVKNKRFINVLMEQLEIPHTFLNYIFLNKNKFENNQIPTEVLLHEQAHAKQKHSLDILILEVIQIIFWFNPLLYWLKKEIKLNHEFLADQNVINQGVDTKTYQNILLEFSSNQPNFALANAINYSSIKKRFTIMKTQTSKPTVWLRSLLLLPLLGVLIYGFSSTKEIEKEVIPKIETKSISVIEDTENTNFVTHDITDYIPPYVPNTTEKEKTEFKNLVNNAKIISKTNQDIKLFVNGIECKGCNLNLSKKGVQNLILSTNTGEKIQSFNVKIPGQKTQFIKGNQIDKSTKKLIENAEIGNSVVVFDIKLAKETLPRFSIQLVIKHDKNYSNSPIIKKGENSSIPPPPPPAPAPPSTPTVPKEEDSERNKKLEEARAKMAAKRTEMEARRNQMIAERNQKITEKEKERMLEMEERRETLENRKAELIKKREAKILALKEKRENIPPPPPPKSPLDHAIDMAKKGASFSYNGEPITSDKAIELLKKNPKLNISSHTNNGVSNVHLSEKPIKIENGKVINN